MGREGAVTDRHRMAARQSEVLIQPKDARPAGHGRFEPPLALGNSNQCLGAIGEISTLLDFGVRGNNRPLPQSWAPA